MRLRVVAAMALGLLFGSVSAKADIGPFYVTITGYCNVIMVYSTVDNIMYGKDISPACPERGVYVGSLSPTHSFLSGTSTATGTAITPAFRFNFDGIIEIFAVSTVVPLIRLPISRWQIYAAPPPLSIVGRHAAPSVGEALQAAMAERSGGTWPGEPAERD